MKYTDLATYVREQTKSDSTTFSDATMTIYFNLAKDEIARAIGEVDESVFGMVMTRDLVEAQRNYAFDETQLNHMKYLEANIKPTYADDGVTITDNDWQRLQCYDIHQLGINTEETELQEGMADYDNGYMMFGNEIILLSADPIIDVTAGLKLWTAIYPQDIDSSDLAETTDISEPFDSTSFGLPISFHLLLAQRIIIMRKEATDKPMALTDREQMWRGNLVEEVNRIYGLNRDQVFVATKPYNDGGDY